MKYPLRTGIKNLIVRFVTHRDLIQQVLKSFGSVAKDQSLPEGINCFAIPRGRNNIGIVDIFVTSDSGTRSRDLYMLHETMNALGLIGHHQSFALSILYYRDPDKQAFSITDKLLLRTLYDLSVVARMSRMKAVLTAKRLIVGFREELLSGQPAEKVLVQPFQ